MDDRKCFSINDLLEVIGDCDLRVWEESQASAADRVRTRLLAKLPIMDSNTARFSVNEVNDLMNDCIVELRNKTMTQTTLNAREIWAQFKAVIAEGNTP